MSTRKDTFLGSGVGKWTTITKRNQYKEDLPIPKFCASLPDLLATGWHAMPARKHWQQEKEPMLCGRVLEMVPWEALAFSDYNLWDPKSVLNQGQRYLNPFTSISQSTLTWSLRYGFSKCNALFSRRKLCYNRKNISIWYNIGFQFLTFSS